MRTGEPPDETSPPEAVRGGGSLSHLLRQARERAGLSQRDVARLMGVSSATVATAELGGDPRRSTLERLAAVLPLLDPRRLLLEGECVGAASTAASWRFRRRITGCTARRVTLRALLGGSVATANELEIEGMRCLSGTLRDPLRRAALIQAVFRGHPDALKDVLDRAKHASEGIIELRDGDVEHVLSFPRDLDSRGFSYVRREPGPRQVDEDAPLAWVPALPAEELLLIARLADRRAGTPVPAVRAASIGGPAIPATDLGASATWDAERQEAVARFTHPLPFMSHELRWAPGADVTHPGSPRPPAEDASVALRLARERAGLSCRALASRLGLSVATVHGAENGLDARRSTLRALLSALPTLRPEDLVAPSDPGRDATKAESWEQYRQLCGVEVGSELKALTVQADGSAVTTHVTTGLRRATGGSQPLIVRHGGGAASPEPQAPELIDQAVPPGDGDAGFRTRLVHRADGSVTHQIQFSPESAARGVSYRRQVRLSGRFPLRAGDAEATRTQDGRAVAGTTLAPSLPTRELVVEVTLPPEHPAKRFFAAAWTPLSGPGPDLPDLAPALHPEGMRLESAPERTSARLVVHEPLVGIRYALLWELED